MLVEQVADLISTCQLRQGELFEEKYTKEERANRQFFDVTDISRQAELEYADRIISVIADDIARTTVGKLPSDTCIGFYDSYIKGAKDEHDYIVEYLRGLLKEG